MRKGGGAGQCQKNKTEDELLECVTSAMHYTHPSPFVSRVTSRTRSPRLPPLLQLLHVRESQAGLPKADTSSLRLIRGHQGVDRPSVGGTCVFTSSGLPRYIAFLLCRRVVR